MAYGSSWARGQIRAAAQVYATTMAMPDLSHICNLHHSLWPCQILNPLREARGQTHILMKTTHWVLNLLSHKGKLPYNIFFSFNFIFCLLGVHSWHMEVPRLGVESKLQLLAYTTATATQDPSCIWNLHYSSLQRWILNPLREARDQIHIFMDPSRVH